MQKIISIKLSPTDATSDVAIKKNIADATAQRIESIKGYTILKSSIDARSRQAWILLSIRAFINEPWQPIDRLTFHFKDVRKSNKKVIIVGAGPAGLFAALHLIENGIQPILLDRGKEVRARRRDLAILNKEGRLDPESNYCFGEGGAGTYSDGKLYTRSGKRGDINRILNLFVHFGAEENILYESHPHIGTNKLPQIISAMRAAIQQAGGVVLFQQKVTGFTIAGGSIKGVDTADGTRFEGQAVILATGHSARDIFHLLHSMNVRIDVKPFALGVRVEHPQALIDHIQYHDTAARLLLPPASYNLVAQVAGRSVFSFCMCPGGIIAPASTNNDELVVNGWSPSKRNNPYANSGMVVPVNEQDMNAFKQFGPLMGLNFQASVEQKAFNAGGGQFVAPAQRLVDFTDNKPSATLPSCSYVPGITPATLSEILPPFIYKALQEGFKAFGKKMRGRAGNTGFLTNEAVVVATESRTSSPVRIPRNDETLQHPQIGNLYPCGEGAGYAGGIVSAAMDGIRVATAINEQLTFR